MPLEAFKRFASNEMGVSMLTGGEPMFPLLADDLAS